MDIPKSLVEDNLFYHSLANARQQNYHQDAITQTDAFQTHLCEVHRVTHDVIEGYRNYNLHDLIEEENETCQVETAMESSNDESGNTENGEIVAIAEAGEKTEVPARKTSEEKHLRDKDEGKSSSKESDVDSGCGSSCHEIYATETSITHAQLSVSSLVYCHAQRAEEANEGEFLRKNSATFFESKGIETKTELVNELCSSPDSSSNESPDTRKSGDETNTFEELIQLAKDGMSTLARKRVDNSGKKNKSSDCLQANLPDLGHSDDQNTSKDTNDEPRNKLEASLKSRIDSNVCPDANQVDDGIKRASSTSLCSGDYAETAEALQCKPVGKQSDISPGLGNPLSCATMSTNNSNAKGSQPGTSTNKRLHSTSSGAYVVEIPTIAFESESETASNSLEATAKYREEHCLVSPRVTLCQKDSNQLAKEDCSMPTESDSNDTQKAETFTKRHHLPLRIQDSLLISPNAITEKTNRPRSMVLPSHIENNNRDEPVYDLKVPSLETLQVPSRGQNTGRIRSFSATIRRKWSFRERTSSDDLDLEKQCPVDGKNKKLKGFRSFRINRRKKTKALKKDEISRSTGCLSDSKKYQSTIDKIFHENTGSALFNDVPFTIPEISEQ